MFSLGEAAQHLGVAYKTIQREVRDGNIGSVKIGRRRMIRDDQLQQYIDDHTIDPDD